MILSTEEEIRYKRLCLHSQIRSLLWGVFKTKHERDGYTMQELADMLDYRKEAISRYFDGDIELSIDELADFARALNIDLIIEAHEPQTEKVFTASGLKSN